MVKGRIGATKRHAECEVIYSIAVAQRPYAGCGLRIAKCGIMAQERENGSNSKEEKIERKNKTCLGGYSQYGLFKRVYLCCNTRSEGVFGCGVWWSSGPVVDNN